MQSDKYTTKLTPEQAAYVAGIMDGEGCIHIHKSKPSPKKGEINTKYVVRIRIAMCCEKTIKALLEMVGYGNVYFRPRQSHQHKDQWAYECSSMQARCLLEELQPYLITKETPAQIAIEFANLPRERRMQNGVSPEIMAERERLYAQMRAFNKNGK